MELAQEENAQGKKSTWKDSPVAIAVIGSLILVVGELFGSAFPLWFGPDLSDYNLVCDPVYHTCSMGSDENWMIDNTNDTSKLNCSVTRDGELYTANITSKIKLISLHSIHHYNKEVYLEIISPPGIYCSISNPTIRRNEIVDLNILVDLTGMLKSGLYGPVLTQRSCKYSIIIQGIGADGKKRNCTEVIEIGLTEEAFNKGSQEPLYSRKQREDQAKNKELYSQGLQLSRA